jgi:DNA-directed RNA polymerase omega subunit
LVGGDRFKTCTVWVRIPSWVPFNFKDNMNALNNSRSSLVNTDLCVENVGNRFDLVLIASIRSREISTRNKHSTKHEHLRPHITALLEIQEGTIGREYLKKLQKKQ